MMHDGSYHSFVFSPCGFGKLIIIIVLPSHTENIMYTILYNSLDVSKYHFENSYFSATHLLWTHIFLAVLAV